MLHRPLSVENEHPSEDFVVVDKVRRVMLAMLWVALAPILMPDRHNRSLRMSWRDITMTDQTPQRDQPQPPRDDARPVMGDHPDLELDDQVRTQPAESGDNPMAKLMIPGIIVLVVVLIIIAFLVF